MLAKLTVAEGQELVMAVTNTNAVLESAKYSGIQCIVGFPVCALWQSSLLGVSLNQYIPAASELTRVFSSVNWTRIKRSP